MKKTRQKTLSYRRVEWFSAKPKTLENLIAEAHSIFTKISQRKFKRPNGQIVKALGYKPGKKSGCFLHIVAETPGDHASTLDHKDENKTDSDVGTTPPPSGSEFMDGDIFAFISGDNVCVCSTILRDSAVDWYCRQLFRKAKFPNSSTMFEFHKVANVDKVKLIATEGVKEVVLGASLYEASVNYRNRTDAHGILDSIGKHLNALGGKDKQAAPDNINVRLSLRTGRGKKIGAINGRKWLNEVATECVETNDDYTIITTKNQRISKSEIFVRRPVLIERKGKSVDKTETWKALENFFNDLKLSGATAQ